MLIKIATTSIATEILLFLISLNSCIPVVRMEKRKNTDALIITAIIKPINKYSPEYKEIVVMSTFSV